MGQGNKTNTLDKIFHNNQELSEDKKEAKVCNEHFIAVGQKLAEDIPSTDESPTANITPAKTKFKFGYITVAQIENVIKRLTNNKATGINGIPNKILNPIAYGRGLLSHTTIVLALTVKPLNLWLPNFVTSCFYLFATI